MLLEQLKPKDFEFWTTLRTRWNDMDALGHINVVLCSSSRTIFSFFRVYGNRLRRTNSFAQFTRDASLLPGWVSSQRVFSAKPWR